MNRRTFVAVLAATIGFSIGLAAVARTQESPENYQNAAPPLIREMAGTWSVQQRMWPAGGANPIELAPAIARRRLARRISGRDDAACERRGQ